MDSNIQSDLIRGNINTIILKALYEGDRYGYDIVREIEQKSGGQYHLKQPTLYSCLKRLETQGFITSYWGNSSIGGRRKYFSLTDMGRELFTKSQDEWIYSRTIIDKLISDKTADLDAFINSEETEKENEDILKDENADETAEKIVEEQADADAQIHEIKQILSDSENLTDEKNIVENVVENVVENAQTATIEQPLEEIIARQPEEKKIPAPTFLDTTQILNQLFSQTAVEKKDASYCEKIVAEKYVVDHSKERSNTTSAYFKDFYNEDEKTADFTGDTPTDSVAVIENIENAAHSPATQITAKPKIEDESENIVKQEYAPIQEQLQPTQTETIPQEAEKNALDDFHKYNENPNIDEKDNLLEREYRNILGSFANENFVDTRKKAETPPLVETAQAEIPQVNNKDVCEKESAATADNLASSAPPTQAFTKDATANKKLSKLAEEARQSGDNIKIRAHSNDTSKEYTNKYYYYSNKLMLVHYGILFCLMALEILGSAVVVYAVMGAVRQKYDLAIYIMSVVFALIFPTVAFIKNYSYPNKRKRINFSLKSSIIYRLIVMIQCMLVVYLVNVIFHMPLSFSIEYIVPVLLPSVLCINFPLSALIFSSLFKSKKYAIIE